MLAMSWASDGDAIGRSRSRAAAAACSAARRNETAAAAPDGTGDGRAGRGRLPDGLAVALPGGTIRRPRSAARCR